MAWTNVEWACGHSGQMQLVGPHRQRDSKVAYEAGRKCMVCWLVEQWEQKNDPRAQREDRYSLAAYIAKGKGKRIEVPSNVPVEVEQNNVDLSEVSTQELIMELEKRESEN